MDFLNKETLIDAAALGGGVIAGRAVVKKLAPMIPMVKDNDYLANALPIVGGIATLYFGRGNRIATGLANGMFAGSAAFYVDSLLQKAGVPSVMNGVMMGNVLMGQTDDSVLMGAAQDMPDYSSSSYDFTPSDSGELNY
jgi:hypothetical protein